MKRSADKIFLSNGGEEEPVSEESSVEFCDNDSDKEDNEIGEQLLLFCNPMG